MMPVNEVAIIGAGPAGLTTALQLKRFCISALLLEANQVGGLLRNANWVENYPGFPGGIAGIDLVKLFEQHLGQLSISLTHDEISELEYADCFRLKGLEVIYAARIVVIASGTTPIRFPAQFVPVNLQNRVFYDVYPLLTVENCQVGIIGAGDAAFDYALNLSRKNRVFLLNRGDRVSCLPLLWERASRSERILYHPNTSVVSITLADDGKILLECLASQEHITVEVDYLIGAIGRRPRLDFLAPALRSRFEQLEAEGLLYYAGDVQRGLYRQTSISVGDGMLAAMKIYYRLKENPV